MVRKKPSNPERGSVEESAPISLDSVAKYLSWSLKDTSLLCLVDATF